METWEWIVLAVLVAAFLVLLGLLVSRRRRRAHLQERFGPEYHRAVSSSGRGDAESRLAAVEREHESIEIRSLPAATRERYLDEWRQAEARFVSDPRDAVRAAERVLARVLEERGYPAEGDTEDRAAHVAVDHPDVVDRYRHGQAMLEEVDGEQSTESLRKAMVDFRVVFEELLYDTRTAA
jgi:hypothetical protein